MLVADCTFFPLQLTFSIILLVSGDQHSDYLYNLPSDPTISLVPDTTRSYIEHVPRAGLAVSVTVLTASCSPSPQPPPIWHPSVRSLYYESVHLFACELMVLASPPRRPAHSKHPLDAPTSLW